jgi:hypothetical protein
MICLEFEDFIYQDFFGRELVINPQIRTDITQLLSLFQEKISV